VSFSLLHKVLSGVFHAVGKRAKVVCPHEGFKTAVEEVQINGPEEVCHVPPPRRVHNLVGTKAVHIQLPKCGTSGVKGHAAMDFRDIVQAYIVREEPVHDKLQILGVEIGLIVRYIKMGTLAPRVYALVSAARTRDLDVQVEALTQSVTNDAL
jgi:hypothetical protein